MSTSINPTDSTLSNSKLTAPKYAVIGHARWNSQIHPTPYLASSYIP